MLKKLNLELFSRRLPLIILAIWLAFIAALVWQHVCESPQPPIYDALSYLQKAKAFWDNVSQGWPHNPLNLVQSVRPPGTVLLSYPFGFSDDYRGFLFRSVIMPFVIWVIAILISVWPVRYDNKPRSYWPAVLAVFLLGPMPFFFQFEYPAQAYWGLMDGFLASLAALAVSCSGRSLMQKSRAWVVAAAAIAVFCPLVKPSGSLVFVLITTFWSGGGILLIWRSKVEDRRESIRFWLFGTILFVILGGLVSWLCLHSQYLSPEVVAFYKQSMVILQSEFGHLITFPIFLSSLHTLFGPQIVIMLIIAGFLICKRSDNCRFEPPTWVFLVASILFCIIGGWFWIVASGVAQVRYFYPFALMIMVPLLIISFRKIYLCDISFPPIILWGVRIACIIPALNLLCLLLVQNPNGHWQKISGVSMKIGSGQSGVQIANKLLNELTKENKSVVVYSISQTIESNSFNCYGWYQNIIHPSSVYFTTVLPIDWQRHSTYRIPEILAVNYILFKPISSSQQENVLNVKKINSLGEEELIFEAFLSSLKPENGLQTKYENQFCRLSEITDKSRLKDAFTSFIKTKSWRPVFVEENEVASAIESKSNPVSITLKVPTRKINNNFETISFSGNNLIISGWGFLDGMNSDFLKSYILLKKNDIVTVFSVNVQIRKDVTKFFNKSGLTLDSTGFFIQIPSENLEKGHYQIGLYILRGNQVGMIYSEKYMDIGK